MRAYEVRRQVVIDADPARIYDLVADLRQWPRWSVWERRDAGRQRSYGSAVAGAGAVYAWTGGWRSGAGSMTVVRATSELVEIEVERERPLRTRRRIAIALEPTPDGATAVTWRTSGEWGGPGGLLAGMRGADHRLGRDIERSLGRLSEVTGQ